ncbi:helix-turn-helix domain-containing protein [Myroides sp. LJL119]
MKTYILIYNDPAKKGQISLYENGKRSLSLDTLEIFMKALRCDFEIKKK